MSIEDISEDKLVNTFSNDKRQKNNKKFINSVAKAFKERGSQINSAKNSTSDILYNGNLTDSGINYDEISTYNLFSIFILWTRFFRNEINRRKYIWSGNYRRTLFKRTLKLFYSLC